MSYDQLWPWTSKRPAGWSDDRKWGTKMNLSEGYHKTVYLSRQLARLISEGKDGSPEAEAIREESDKYWFTLTEVEKEISRVVSESYTIFYEQLETLEKQITSKLKEDIERVVQQHTEVKSE